jgi:4-aminobutyrate aminotransferase-like enzyme/Ser/Thr protein kinase RdoA (MazF antagonist)
MTQSAFLERTGLPRPEVSEAQAAAILEAHFGLKGAIRELGSQQDRNFRIDTGAGRFVLKLCWAEYATIELEAQNAALRHLAGKPGVPRVPRPHISLGGEEIVQVEVNEQALQARLLDYLDGSPLTGQQHLPMVTIAALGDVAGRLAHGLADFDHPGLTRDVQWDLRKAEEVVAHQLRAIANPATRQRIGEVAESALTRVRSLLGKLRVQPVHHDVTDDNVVSRPDPSGHAIPDGVIDFGDITHGWVAGDLASTCAALLHHTDGDPFDILPAISAYHAVHPLTGEEVAALWPLIVLRAAVLVAANEQQLAVESDNAYVLGNAEREWRILDVASRVPFLLMETAIHHALGFDSGLPDLPAIGRLVPDLDPERINLVDLGVISEAFEAGNWSTPGLVSELLAKARSAHGAAATRYGEYRLTETRIHSLHDSPTFALHVDLWLEKDSAIVAPFAGLLTAHDHGSVVQGDGLALHLGGLRTDIAPGTPVSRGQVIGAAERLRIQFSRGGVVEPPLFSTPRQSAAWAEICPSPAALLGLDCNAPQPDSAGLLERRKRHFARPQKNYYQAPPQIERGFRQHMYDVTGQAFLDMVNNVTILGHGHPRLAEAVRRQWSLLNTNSRFHYAAVTEFSERLAKLAPQGLDTVFLVNSGSEANDLALRLAWAHTGARNMLCLLEAYHGWSVASDAVSTSIADNPQALTTRPPWVHPMVSPNTYRGPYRGPDTTGDYLATVAPVLEKIDRSGEGLAGFIAESVYGNAGGIPLPDGYLKAVYDMVRARGGVCIADEVQVGYGRLGHYFWGFEQQGAVPDIISIAKGMGNGHPLGAVITTREIADSLEREGYFFSSAGGSPVSCVVGNTVLDIMEDEGLIENARIVGDHLKARLEALGQRFPIVGAVHGMGLYLGLEFVRDRASLQPATRETERICDRLMELGVIMQPTGDHLNVLKIKPPMCLTKESADYFADMLAKVLAEGY